MRFRSNNSGRSFQKSWKAKRFNSKGRGDQKARKAAIDCWNKFCERDDVFYARRKEIPGGRATEPHPDVNPDSVILVEDD